MSTKAFLCSSDKSASSSVSMNPRRYAVDRDLSLGDLFGQGLGEGHLPRFRGGIVGLPGKAEGAAGRSNVDDSTESLPGHGHHCQLAHVVGAVEIDRHNPAPIVDRHEPYDLVLANARVVDQHLGRTGQFLEEAFRRGVVRNVEAGQVKALGRFDRCLHGLGRRIVTRVRSMNFGTRRQKAAADGQANAPVPPVTMTRLSLKSGTRRLLLPL